MTNKDWEITIKGITFGFGLVGKQRRWYRQVAGQRQDAALDFDLELVLRELRLQQVRAVRGSEATQEAVTDMLRVRKDLEITRSTIHFMTERLAEYLHGRLQPPAHDPEPYPCDACRERARAILFEPREPATGARHHSGVP